MEYCSIWGPTLLLAILCHSVSATDALITVLMYPFLRHRGGVFLGSVLVLLTLGAHEGVFGVQLPCIDATGKSITPHLGEVPVDRTAGLTAAVSLYPSPWAARPLPTPCRAGRAHSGPKPVCPTAETDTLPEKALCTLLEESCSNQQGYPYYLAAALLDTLHRLPGQCFVCRSLCHLRTTQAPPLLSVAA